jgi:hypothetical protein
MISFEQEMWRGTNWMPEDSGAGPSALRNPRNRKRTKFDLPPPTTA